MTVKSQFLSYLAPFSPHSFTIKKFILLPAALGMSFSAYLMETASLISGAVMEKRTVKTAVMKKAAMEPFDCVTRKPSFPAGAQVRTMNIPGAEPLASASIRTSFSEKDF